MILVTTDYITGKTLEPLGIVLGEGVSTAWGSAIPAVVENIHLKLTEEAQKLEADAIINIRYTFLSANFGIATGTAVKFI